jgi:NAD-dependent DNA ligase
VLWADTLLPQDTPQELRELRRNELRKIRGELFIDDDANKQLQAQKREGAQNIYDYQVRGALAGSGCCCLCWGMPCPFAQA